MLQQETQKQSKRKGRPGGSPLLEAQRQFPGIYIYIYIYIYTIALRASPATVPGKRSHYRVFCQKCLTALGTLPVKCVTGYSEMMGPLSQFLFGLVMLVSGNNNMTNVVRTPPKIEENRCASTCDTALNPTNAKTANILNFIIAFFLLSSSPK